MDRPGWIKLIRALLSLMVIIYAAILAVPVMTKAIESPLGITMYIPSADSADKSADAYRWIARSLKLDNNVEGGIPDVLVITPGVEDLDAALVHADHNLIIGEGLLSDKSEGSRTEDVEKIEQLFDIHFSGWSGRYFKELAYGGGVPEKLIELHEASGKKWAFSGSGIVLVNGSQVVVLESEKDIAGMPVLKGLEGAPADYSGWFEILAFPENGSDVGVAGDFTLSVTGIGKKMLQSLGLSERFPAVLERTSALSKTRYHAGDFGNVSIGVPSWSAISPVVASKKGIFDKNSNEELFWKQVYPWANGFFKDMAALKSTGVPHGIDLTKSVGDTHDNPFFIEGRTIVKERGDGNKEAFFINGVNIGTALPGRFFTEMPLSYDLYREWLDMQSGLGVNTVRVYTLLPPMFYRALHDHNQVHDEKLYLLQEIWPDEHPKNKDYLNEAYDETYKQEIRWVVSAIHGDVTIPPRQYKAYGNYAYDVSDYLIGFLVGRELEPEEVVATNQLNPDYSFSGRHFMNSKEASPTEAWLAQSCDETLAAAEKYGKLPLVAIVSWPPLDTIEHESGWTSDGKSKIGVNDIASIDINHIVENNTDEQLLFGAYHVYPNYPDFINEDTAYAYSSDEKGSLRFKGYLEAFIATHGERPAVIAEYGMSNSMMTAHVSPDGLNHGGLSEQQQAEGLIRLNDAIVETGYAGAIIFQWVDEWAKRTWITEPYMIPYARHPLWHNVMDPEQNYGLVAIESMGKISTSSHTLGVEGLERIETWNDHAFVGMDLVLESGMDAGAFLEKGLRIGISTHNPTNVTGGIVPEFELRFEQGIASILVKEGYNWTNGRYEPEDTTGAFEKMRLQTNPESWLRSGKKNEAISIDLSTLNIGAFSDSRCQVSLGDGVVRIRLPYMLLGISDPSSLRVLDDENRFKAVSQDQIKTSETSGVTFVIHDKIIVHDWKPWDSVDFKYRPKTAFGMVKERLGE